MWEKRAKKLWPKLELLCRTEIKEQLLDVEYTRKQGTQTRAANKCDRTCCAVLAFERMAKLRRKRGPRLAPGNHTFRIRVRFLR